MTKPITDAFLAMLDDRRDYWNKYAYTSEGHEIVHPMEYDALRERLRRAEAVVGWAESALDMYGFASDYQDPMHQLSAAVRDYRHATSGKE